VSFDSGKKVDSPREISGICCTETTLAQPKRNRMVNNPEWYLISDPEKCM
jgi:hypothetical protein